MYAKRMNRTYPINTPQEKQAYLARGYDIFDEDDDLVEASPQKTIPYAEHQKLRAASEAMRKELYAIRAENEQLRARLAAPASFPINDAQESATPPAGVMEVFDAPPTMPTSDDTPEKASDGEVKTLRSTAEPAPKMGEKKK